MVGEELSADSIKDIARNTPAQATPHPQCTASIVLITLTLTSTPAPSLTLTLALPLPTALRTPNYNISFISHHIPDQVGHPEGCLNVLRWCALYRLASPACYVILP